MSQRIVLPNDTRLFKRSFGDANLGILLSRANTYMEKGTSVEIGDPVTMTYDHRDQLVVPIINNEEWDFDCQHFMIVSEMGTLNAPMRA